MVKINNNIPPKLQANIAKLLKEKEQKSNTQSETTPKKATFLNAVSPHDIKKAIMRLLALLQLDGDSGPRNDVKKRGYYLNIIL